MLGHVFGREQLWKNSTCL